MIEILTQSIRSLRSNFSVRTLPGCETKSTPGGVRTSVLPSHFLRGYFEHQSLSSANHFDRCGLAGAFTGEQSVQLIDSRYRMAGKSNDQITFPQAGLTRRAILFERDDQNRSFDRQIVVTHEPTRQRYVLTGNADKAARNASVANQFSRDEFRRVDSRSKTNSLRRPDNRCVDPNHLSIRSHQRPTRVAGIERRVSLNYIIDQTTRL